MFTIMNNFTITCECQMGVWSRFVYVFVSNQWGVLILIITSVYACLVNMAWWNSLAAW